MLPILLERSPDGVDGQRVGPVEGLRLHGRLLQIAPSNLEIAHFDGYDSRADGKRFAALVIESRVLVCVQRSRRHRGPFYGPFDFVRIANGRISTSVDGRLTFAQFDAIDANWHVCHEQTRWPTIVFLACGQ